MDDGIFLIFLSLDLDWDCFVGRDNVDLGEEYSIHRQYRVSGHLGIPVVAGIICSSEADVE